VADPTMSALGYGIGGELSAVPHAIAFQRTGPAHVRAAAAGTRQYLSEVRETRCLSAHGRAEHGGYRHVLPPGRSLQHCHDVTNP